MAFTVMIRYSGTEENLRAFAKEMKDSGTIDAIRKEEGNLAYTYYWSQEDPEVLLLVDRWESQEALDVHHASPLMQTISDLLEKYEVNRYIQRFTDASEPQVIPVREKKTMETQRLILRPWALEDVPACFELAKDPKVGPVAGWPPHQNIEETTRIVSTMLMRKGTFAIVEKETGKLVGDISLRFGRATDLTDQPDECELGYWLGVPYWDRGYMTEAVKELLRYAFRELGVQKVWAGYYEGNLRSKRVQEKCGMTHQWTNPEVDVPQMGEKRIGHVQCISKEEWEKTLGKECSYPTQTILKY